MSWQKIVLGVVLLIVAVVAWMGRYEITEIGKHGDVYWLDRWTGNISFIKHGYMSNVENLREMSSDEIKMLVDKKQLVYERSQLLDETRKKFPTYDKYDDEQFAMIVSRKTGVPYDKVVQKFGIQSPEPSKLEQLRAGNPAYSSYSDKQFISVIANKIDISPEELEKRIDYK